MSAISEFGIHQIGFHNTIICIEFADDGALLFVPPQAAEVLGYAAEETASMNINQVFASNEKKRVSAFFNTPVDSRLNNFGQYHIQKKSGEIIPAHISIL